MALTSKQRSQLRGLAAAEDTIIQVGKGGINENLVASVASALKARELVKGKVLHRPHPASLAKDDAQELYVREPHGTYAVHTLTRSVLNGHLLD